MTSSWSFIRQLLFLIYKTLDDLLKQNKGFGRNNCLLLHSVYYTIPCPISLKAVSFQLVSSQPLTRSLCHRMNHETRLHLTKHVKVTVGCSDMLMDFEFRKCCSCGEDERFVKVEVTCALSLGLLQLGLRNRRNEEREKSSF